MTNTLILTATFCAAHLYHQKDWDESQNRACFGKCFSEFGHGHNYRLEVGFTEPISPREELQTRLQVVTDRLDHHHLNFKIPEFQDLIPTTENIALYLLKKLQEDCPNERLSYIKLFEMDDLWVKIETGA